MSTIKALGIPKVKALGLNNSNENTYKNYLERKRKYNIAKNIFPDLDLEKISVVEYIKTYNTKTA